MVTTRDQQKNLSQSIIAPPIFLKSNLVFKLANVEYRYQNYPISIFGISGIRWSQFDPLDRVGERVQITVDVLSKVKFSFTTSATLTAEITTDANYLGMRFNLSESDFIKLSNTIKQEGFHPTNYIRKYPRIPASPVIPSMPLRAVAKITGGEFLAFDIANMSPNGILLQTENPNANLYVPGTRIHAQVDPRGQSYSTFTFEGMVCRIVLDKNPISGNPMRLLGIRFMRIEDNQKENLVEILRLVLQNIQNTDLVSKK